MTQKFSVSFADALAKAVRQEAQIKNLKISQLLQGYAEAGLATATVSPSSQVVKTKADEKTILCSAACRTGQATVEKELALRRFKEPMKKAIRLVLVDGLTQADAALKSGVAHRQAINRAIKSLGDV